MINTLNKQVYSRNYRTNTKIGGIGATIVSKSSLATKLGISETWISNFSISSNDVYCNIRYDYNIPSGAFLNNLEITSFFDYSGKVIQLLGSNANSACFKGTTNLIDGTLPKVNTMLGFVFYESGIENLFCAELTTINGPWTFRNSNLKQFVAPILTSLYSPAGFSNVPLEVFYAPKCTYIETNMSNAILDHLHLPEVITYRMNNYGSTISSIDLPKCKYVTRIGGFRVNGLTSLNAPLLEELECGNNTGSSPFADDATISSLNFPSLTKLTRNFFLNNTDSWVNLTDVYCPNLIEVDWDQCFTFAAKRPITLTVNTELQNHPIGSLAIARFLSYHPDNIIIFSN
tara:strand:+ start:342 stop:1376 length:1035 start_codon:yes stop_codon:yes gene_type:complete